MCDICGNLPNLIAQHDKRLAEGRGLYLTQYEVLSVVEYVQIWQQRQCMCCFKDFKNFEKLNNLVQVALHQAIKLIASLVETKSKKSPNPKNSSPNTSPIQPSKLSPKEPFSLSEENRRKTLTEKGDNDIFTEDQQEDHDIDPGTSEFEFDVGSKCVKKDSCDENTEKHDESEKLGLGTSTEEAEEVKSQASLSVQPKEDGNKESQTEEKPEDEDEQWSLEQKDSLFHMVTKVFLLNFPLYLAYKHCVHGSLEELTQQEASALNNYCELSDPEISVYLLRNVCFFCDSNGVQSISRCFEAATPQTLSCTVAHTLINIVANLRLWMNTGAVVQLVNQVRGHMISYMCQLTDSELRQAAAHNMMDLLWAAVKEPLEANMSFDQEGLKLAFKYFTCTTLTIRLTGISQINNQISMYNELANNDNLMDTEGIGHQLADWLTNHNIIGHIFGPNLHVEIIKQSQVILNLLASEGHITKDHIETIWAAAQLKHCGKQVHDILLPLIKSLEVAPGKYLLHLISNLDPSQHTEQTLLLASTVIKFLWTSSAQPCHAIDHHACLMNSSAEQGHPTDKVLVADFSSSGHSDSEASGGELEEGEINPDIVANLKASQITRAAQQRVLKVRPSRGGLEDDDDDDDGDDSCEDDDDDDDDEDDDDQSDEISNISEGSLHSDDMSDEEEDEEVLPLERKPSLKAKFIARKVFKGGHLAFSQKHLPKLIPKQKRLVDQYERKSERKAVEKVQQQQPADESEDEEEDMFCSEESDSECKMCCEAKEQPSSKVDDADPSNHPISDKDRLNSAKTAAVDIGDSHDKSKKSAEHWDKPGVSDIAVEDRVAGQHGDMGKLCGPHPFVIPGEGTGDAEQVALLHELDVHSGSSEGGDLEQAYLHFTEPVLQDDDLKSYLEQSGQVPCSHTAKDELMSGDEGSCNSSHLSAKSDKNMADFEGEDVMSEEELTSIAAAGAQGAYVRDRSRPGLPLQQHLANMAQLYHKHIPKVGPQHKVTVSSEDTCGITQFEDVCQLGNTLLWDLLQDQNIYKLPEGLVQEAEKILSTLVCFSTDASIRTKFIEACVENLANHRSVVISLRLLPKIFGSFNQFRSGLDTHSVTYWAEKELQMMKHFFNNLKFYTNAVKKGVKFPHALYSYREEIQVRLQFLTCLFSNAISDERFRLTLEQVDALWTCLALDPDISDDVLNWFLNQAKSKDHHAMDLHTFGHIFKQKMALLKPEDTSMVGLNLFTHLCPLAKIDKQPNDQITGMEQLWAIALKAHNTDVSLTAIHYLNNHYINADGANLAEMEDEFIKHCMESLYNASMDLDKSPEGSLLVLQRGLILLTNHLESFRKRHAFHLRKWQLEGSGIRSHQQTLQHRHSTPIRVQLQPAGASEKTMLEMLSSDLVAELRAEVVHWWEIMQRKQKRQKEAATASTSSCSVLTPILGAMLGDGPIRMITLGQELTTDVDEKTLAEMQFKDCQMMFVSLGASRHTRKQESSSFAPYPPAPSRCKLPMMLLLGEPHFDRLFCLLQQLSSFRPSQDINTEEQYCLQTKARVLSRKVWDLLMLLPTNLSILQGFKDVAVLQESGDGANVDWEKLLDAHNPHKLMYSLQMVESISRPPPHRRHSVFQSRESVDCGDGDCEGSVSDELPEEAWSRQFLQRGGMKHLFCIFMSGSLQGDKATTCNEWVQDCLAYLLRLLCQFAVTTTVSQSTSDDVFPAAEITESPRKKLKKIRSQEHLIVPRLNQTIMSLIEGESVVKILMTILYDATVPSCEEYSGWPTGSWGRVEVVHYALYFLVSLCFTCGQEVQQAVCNSKNYANWLRRLTLETPEPEVRQEACQGLYRLCLGRTGEGSSGYSFLLPTLAGLLSSLKQALSLKTPQKRCQDEKEPFGAGCRDFFWLVCRLVENVHKEDAELGWGEDGSLVDLNSLMREVAESLVKRPYIELRNSSEEDDGLIGLLNLCASLAKLNPPFKSSSEGQAFLLECFGFLFALPSLTRRYLPKCKSSGSRSAAYDLLVEMSLGSVENYTILNQRMTEQNHKDSHLPYAWDNWPHEEERSECGYVGLTNLGATCYMATCMQHLYMIPEARRSVLQASRLDTQNKHQGTLQELQKMFTYLSESERKAYNPRSFCKVYTMDHQPLNTGEQKDMTEFFTDLISKLEEMGWELKKLVKSLFGGVITNNVVSLDCDHVSRTKEEFYTVRCQVAGMKNILESLDEVTVKDMLEGDNMYTCSKCQKKVRAEKRACFKKLPKILCFNTMRYTFNMVTMMKEKVNTHFSFPLCLDMSPYMEENLIQKQKLQDESDDDEDGLDEDTDTQTPVYDYELIGVTVHTGTADGGHYYSFIRDRLNKNENGQDKWFLFNDAEVKPFDPQQIASECFGGEMTSKTYDSVTDKFMDFSFEKTNSAYMLFYERISSGSASKEVSREGEAGSSDVGQGDGDMSTPSPPLSISPGPPKLKVDLSQDLADWIWQDNMQFLQDKNLFEHTYFNFMWQMCSYIPQCFAKDDNSERIQSLAAKLTASFVLETLIHAKEKPTMLQWIELLTKKFNASPAACEWFLDSMAEEDWWPQQILIKCPNQTVRQMFHRLVIHVITQLKPAHCHLYTFPAINSDDEEEDSPQSLHGVRLTAKSCVTRFISRMLMIIDQGPRAHCKYLGEYFNLLYDFAKMGDIECRFLRQVNAISMMVCFFMGHKNHNGYVEFVSEEEEESEDMLGPTLGPVVGNAASEDCYRPQSLEKMITLIALLVEKSRSNQDKQLHLSQRDYQAIIGGKGFPFLYNQILDSINLRQTCNLIFSMCRWNERLALHITQMIFTAISRLGADSQPFFKLLSMLVEFVGGPPGLPPFTHYVLQRFWEVAEFCPRQCLDWLCSQVTRSKLAHTWTLQNLEVWVEPFLMGHTNLRVRNAAAYLLVALVPNNQFRQMFCTNRTLLSPHKEPINMSEECRVVLHEIFSHLLSLLSQARQYVEPQVHGFNKLVFYFACMQHCLVSREEKLMFSRYTMELWHLFQPKLSEPSIPTLHNKQALLLFWHQACVDCADNIKLIVSNPNITKNIAFNYILADHDEQEVVAFNRIMLPAYYGILRLCCQQSRTFTRQLAQHQNIQWAFKNITTYPTQYTAAVEELFNLMRLMVAHYPDTTDEEMKAIHHFRRSTLQLYLHSVDARTSWQTLVTALGILVESREDRLQVLQSNGLVLLHEAFSTLHVMHHEATACHVTTDIIHLLGLISSVLKVARHYNNEKKGSEVKPHIVQWTDRTDFCRKLLTLLNSFNSPDLRTAAIDTLREMVLTFQTECLQTIVPFLVQAHGTFQDNNVPMTMGSYFPKRGQRSLPHKTTIRPSRPQFQMFLHSNQLESTKGVDDAYDTALHEFYSPYHTLVDLLLRVAINHQSVNEPLVNLSAMVAYEGVPLHSPYFAKLWYEIYQTDQVDKNYVLWLCSSSNFIDYVDAVLLDERFSLNNHHIYQFFCNYFPKVYQQVLNDQGQSLMDSLLSSIAANMAALENITRERNIHKLWANINGDLRAMLLIFSVQQPRQLPLTVIDSVHFFHQMAAQHKAVLRSEAEADRSDEVPAKRRRTSSDVSNSSAELEPPATHSKQAGGDKSKETEAADKEAKDGEDVKPSEQIQMEDEEPQPSTSTAPHKTGRERTISSSSSSSTTVPTVSSPSKERPTIVDMVLKNSDHVLKMLQKCFPKAT